MDALDALSPERPVLSTRLWWGPKDVTPRSTDDGPARAAALVAQLPVLVRGGWSPAVSLGPEDALLRLQAAIWELAARRNALVGPECTAVDVARLLSARGAMVPPAAEAAAVLADLLARRDGDLGTLRAAARLTAYVELRARFG